MENFPPLNIKEAVQTDLDPIVILDFDYISAHNSKVITAFMNKIGASDVTKTLR
jgi:hypothetical protein